MAELIEMPFELRTRVNPVKHVLHRGAHRHNLANTIEPSVFVGPAETAEMILPFGMWTRVGPTKDVLDGDPDRRIPRGNF